MGIRERIIARTMMRINHTLTCVLHRHGHALCVLHDIMMINEIMKPTLCIELTCDSSLVHFLFSAPFRLPSTSIRPS